MRLAHYSREPLGDLTPVEQPDHPAARMWGKPEGLWISVEALDGDSDDGWRSWCKSEMPQWAFDQKHETVFTLRPDARVMMITSEHELDAFQALYGTSLRSPTGYVFEDLIDWIRLAQDYQGIIIAPYIWSRRLHPRTRWYYGWDCASGCFWDPSCLERITK